jgi:hypothetical protein
MSAGTIVAIVIVVIVVAAVIAAVSLAARRRRLQQRFGPEYDRVVEDSDSRLRAESELAGREKRVRELDIRPLDPAARASYLGQWTAIQQQFVDTPAEAVTAAQSLITTVMTDRGYPTEDADQIVADLSVEHAATLGHYRTAQDISTRVADSAASTEDMRQAMIHYRSLFQDLLGEPTDEHEPTEPVPATPALDDSVTDDPAASPVVADPVAPDRVSSGRHAAAPDVTEPDEPVAEALPEGGDAGLDPVYPDEPLRVGADDQSEPAASSRRPWRR